LGGGCSLYLGASFVGLPFTTNAAGCASLAVPVPYDPSLVSASVRAQAFVLDPAGPFAGLALSGGLRLVLGY